MATQAGLLSPGDRAPAFDLPLAAVATGRAVVPDPQGTGPTLLVFFKDSCPTCRFILPFVQRLHGQVAGRGGRILGISQDGPEGARAIAGELGLEFPIAVDDPGFPVSNAWGLLTVPTLYLVDPEGMVTRGRAGFDRADLESMAGDLARGWGAPPPALYHEGENIPPMKPG